MLLCQKRQKVVSKATFTGAIPDSSHGGALGSGIAHAQILRFLDSRERPARRVFEAHPAQ